LLDDFRVLGRDVLFLAGVGLEVEQLPGVLVVFLVEAPILPAHGDQVTADGVTLVRGRKTRFLPVAGGVEERGRDRPRITSTPFPPAMPKGRSR